MRRSKELFEYLSQHGMYTRDPGDPAERVEPPEIDEAPAAPKTRQSKRRGTPDAADPLPTVGPKPRRRPKKTAALSRPPSPGSAAPGGESATPGSFGDQSLSLTYNNAAVCAVFVLALLVLSYFLGFSQGAGDRGEREFQIRMDSQASGVAPEVEPGDPSEIGLAEPQGNAATTAAGGDSGANGTRSGFLDEQRTVYSVRVFTATAQGRVYANDHVNDLRGAGYDARLEQRGSEFRVYVGRFDDRDNPGLEKLVDELRAMKRQYPDSGRVEYPYAEAYVEEIRP